MPQRAAAGRLVVCERTSRWAVAIRQAWGEDCPLREARSVSQGWDELAAAPASFVVVELAPGWLDPLLDRLVWLGRDYPLARAAVAGASAQAGYRWPLYEAGAVLFVASCSKAEWLVETARRHLARAAAQPEDLRERIRSRLPWG